jgi:hypothetical protein
VNTIVNDDGVLTAANTDYIAVQQLIAEHGLDPGRSVLIRGSGGMASAVATAFRDSGFGAERSWPATARPGPNWPGGSATSGVPMSGTSTPP